MEQITERRGPIEKSEKGWPINPFGVIALVFFIAVVGFLIAKPILSPKSSSINLTSTTASGGNLVMPLPGDIIKGKQLTIELSVDEPQKAQKVQFWAKTYADGKWQMIGETESTPFKLNWQIPQEFQNKAIAITSHIIQKDGEVIKDPGGWREGIIILSQ